MSKYNDNIMVVREFAALSAKGKNVSSYMKQKIPVKLRKLWYAQTVVPAIAEYNRLCKDWLKENVK